MADLRTPGGRALMQQNLRQLQNSLVAWDTQKLQKLTKPVKKAKNMAKQAMDKANSFIRKVAK